MSEVRRGEWTSPEKQQDEEYQAKMKNFFAPHQQQTPKPAGRGRGPLADDTAVLPRVDHAAASSTAHGSAGAPGGATGGVLGGAVPEDGSARPLREMLAFVLLAGAALCVLALLFWFFFLRGGEDEAAKDAPSDASVSVAGLKAKDTNLVFQKPVEGKDGSYSIRLGEYEWEGTKKLNGDVEEVVLEGRTAANFTTAVRLTHGQITTGVFGRAEPSKPMWEATFLRTTTNGRETTTGNYHAVDEGEVILQGSYFDRVVEDNAGDEPDVIVRTYVEGDPREEGSNLTRYSATFRAPEETEIPWLPGWHEPAAVPESGS